MFSVLQQYWPAYLEGFKFTLIASVIALVFSLIIGALMGIMQTSHVKIVRTISNIYVEFFRNIPLLIIVMFFYVVIPLYLFPVTGFASGVIGLTIYTSSFIADNVRAGIQAIDPGQMEAGMSQGFSYSETMRYIIFPQAVRVIIPPLGNQTINLVKNSSILAMVAGLDLMYQGDLISQQTFNVVETYVIVGIFYLCITFPLTYFNKFLERRLAL